VSNASLTKKSSASSSRASAGTRSPADKQTTSPGTRFLAGRSNSRPSAHGAHVEHYLFLQRLDGLLRAVFLEEIQRNRQRHDDPMIANDAASTVNADTAAAPSRINTRGLPNLESSPRTSVSRRGFPISFRPYRPRRLVSCVGRGKTIGTGIEPAHEVTDVDRPNVRGLIRLHWGLLCNPVRGGITISWQCSQIEPSISRRPWQRLFRQRCQDLSKPRFEVDPMHRTTWAGLLVGLWAAPIS